MSVKIKGSGILPNEFKKDIYMLSKELVWGITTLLIQYIKNGEASIQAYSSRAVKQRQKYGLQTDEMDFTTNEDARSGDYSFGEEMLRYNPRANMIIKGNFNQIIARFDEESASTKWKANVGKMKDLNLLIKDNDFQEIVETITKELMSKANLFHRE